MIERKGRANRGNKRGPLDSIAYLEFGQNEGEWRPTRPSLSYIERENVSG
jgi:hypothetical protein